MRRGVIILLAAAALLLPAAVAATPAHAWRFDNPRYERDYRWAINWYWGTGRPPLCSSVDREVVRFNDRGLLDETTIPSEPETECSMYVEAELGPCLRREVIAHAVGHLLGLQHTTDPSSIMYPYVDPHDPTLCQRMGVTP